MSASEETIGRRRKQLSQLPIERTAFNQPDADDDCSQQTDSSDTSKDSLDLFPVFVGAIQTDNVQKVKRIIDLDHFDKQSLDALVYKACERSKDIIIEEQYVTSGKFSDSEDERTMLEACQTSKKYNDKIIDLLVEAETHASEHKPKRKHYKPNKTNNDLRTPPQPELKSGTKVAPSCTMTPEKPKLKSQAYRALKY